MSKHKKTFTIFGLAAATVILVGAIFVFSQPPKQNDPDMPLDKIAGDVAVGGIESGAPVTEPGIKPDPITTPDPSSAEPSGSDIPLTVIEDKPEPPELPENVHETTPSTDESGAATNPEKKPDSSPKPAETTPPKDNTPKSGDKDGNGNVYIPGFGWVKDEGGGGQGEKSQLDPEHSDFDKIIGQ